MRRRRRFRRFALGVAGLVLVAAIVLAGAITWLVATPSGLQFALAQARPWLPEGVRIESAEGRLIGPLRVNGLELRLDAATVNVQRIDLDWAPAALVSGEVHVRDLAVDRVAVTLADTGDAPAPEGAPAIPGLPDELALPVAIRVDRLAVAPIELTLADGTAHRIDRIALGARVGPDALVLDSLRAEAPAGRVEAHLESGPAAPYPVNGRIEWQWEAGGDLPALAGNGRFSGTLADLRIDHELTAPTAVTLNAALQLFDGTPTWQADLTVPKTRPAQWLSTAPELEASADLKLEGTLDRVSARGDFGLGAVPGGPYRGRIDVQADTESLRIAELAIRPVERGETMASLKGSVTYAGANPRFDAMLDWHGLQWPLTGAPTARSTEGRMALEGTLDSYQLDGRARVSLPDIGPDEPAVVELQGGGNVDGLERFNTRIDWGGARLAADGQVRWQAPGNARIRADLSGVDPERFGAAIGGRLAAGLEAEARWGETGVSAEVTLDRFEGELDGRPLDGAAELRYADGTLEVPRLRVAAGDARLEASGRAGERLAVDWSVTIPDVRALTGVGGGRLSGSGQIGGTPAAPSIRTRMEGAALEWATLRIDSLGLNADAVLAEDRDSSVDLSLSGVEVGEESLERVSASLAGRPGDHRLEIAANGPRGEVDLTAAGALEDVDWRGRLTGLQLRPAGRAAWTLAEPAPLRWVDGRGSLEDLCLLQAPARLCLTGQGAPEDWSARIQADTVPLALIGGFGPEELEYEGELELQARLQGGPGPVTGDARLGITGGRVTGPVDDETRTLMAWESGSVEAQLAPERLDGRIQLPLSDGGRLAATVGIELNEAAALSGRVQARIDDLSLIAALVPAIGRVEGQLNADVGLGGTLEDPRLTGGAELAEGRVTVIPIGIAMTALDLDLETVGSGFRVRLGGRSGEGQMEALIDLRRGDAGAWSGEGRISGKSFTAVDTAELGLEVSPDLNWQVEGRRIQVNGNVAIPHARIEPRDLSGAVQPSSDAVIVGADGEVPETAAGWEVFADVGVDLGEDVHVDAFGLDGRLGGNINVRERPGQLTTATGELRVEEGKYTIYRQSLEIERGRVLFDGGPVADPGLDVRAVRRPRDVIVGVDVRGTLRQPRATLFSEPPMPESQQLSYLIAGVPLGESSGSERSAMAAAAAAIATSEQGQAFASKLGIQEVSVDRGEVGESDGASLVLGRYLSPRLYVGYGIGLAEQANSVRMRYELTRRWSVEARSGAAASADLLYSIETDGGVEP